MNLGITLSNHINLLQIGALSIKIPTIIGINTSPIIHCFNLWNIDNVKKWVILDNKHTYSYNDRIFKFKSFKDVIINLNDII